MAPPQKQHFLVVAYPAQGHINPARALAARLARSTGAHVTLSAAVSAHRRMFPSLSSPDDDVIAGDGDEISYFPYSDGYDDGFRLFAGDGDAAWRNIESFDRVGRATFAAVLDRLAAVGRPPVTCVVYAFLMWWAADVAREKGIPRAMYWIQPATMLAVYYGYLHGDFERHVAEHAGEPGFEVALPGLPPMAIRDLPSFFTDLADRRLAAAFHGVRRTVEQVDIDRRIGEKPIVLVNTVEELESDVIAAAFPDLEILAVGPAIGDGNATSPPSKKANDMYEHDEKAYMEWLDGKAAGSVVYVSFGSMSATSKRQKEEIRRGLAAAARPFLWVVRRDDRDGDDDLAVDQVNGMVVEWCDQVRVLAHAAVGCFVTHCGWNSTLESVVSGTPVVAAPQWSDQDTNARLVEGWGVGVHAATGGDRVLEGDELARCVEKVMGQTEEAAAIRRSSIAWKATVEKTVAPGGSSERNLKAFLDRIANVA